MASAQDVPVARERQFVDPRAGFELALEHHRAQACRDFLVQRSAVQRCRIDHRGDSRPVIHNYGDRIDLRGNASLFRSRVQQVPGPDNRLDQQPDYTVNLGADYRVVGLPVTLGGNLNWTPGYT